LPGLERTALLADGEETPFLETAPRMSRHDPLYADDPQDPDADEFGLNAVFVEEIRRNFEADPGSVDAAWSGVFDSGSAGDTIEPRDAERYSRVLRLIHAYRSRGHRVAATDPLGEGVTDYPELDPAHYGFGHDDLHRPAPAGDLPGGPVQPLGEILQRLRASYCGSVGVEFTHLQDPGRRQWLQQRMEETENATAFAPEQRRRILEQLTAAEAFEHFLARRFLGQKRFSLEGAESLIPLLDTLVEDAPAHGIREIVIGMSHRGRLNVLAHTLAKPLDAIFSEFEDLPVDLPFGSGDVKYHKGFSSDRETRSGDRVHLSLTANPSHLEAVDPVVEGRARAKQVRAGDAEGRTIVPLLIHGDAAFAGQGIVAETLNLSNLAGYSTGGTLHVVVNNQIGFTTPPAEARSTLYATDVAKMIQAPIFHVNGDDPEAVLHCLKLALVHRQRFGRDVVIDLVCYRRHGHNEADEPAFTQPLLYKKIRRRPPLRERYARTLAEEGVIRAGDAERMASDRRAELEHALERIAHRAPTPGEPYELRGPWTGLSRTAPESPPETAVDESILAGLAERCAGLPDGFRLHPKLAPLIERRRNAISDGAPIDWATAELLAFASLLADGHSVRLSGQDSVRGTFSHRHAAFVDQSSGVEFAPLARAAANGARFDAFDSLLSEAAVLGFEYGYSLADPGTLTLWEAQFGDFANGAQVIIDQFITSAHAKWQRMSGLVLLLPHGHEGQGPDHSSARLERFLQACAGDNLQVVNCTTPAQYFHVLRRQMVRSFRTPLVVATPKSLLRHPEATSSPADLSRGRFEAVLDDPAALAAPDAVRRVVFCTGKLYYELLAERGRRHSSGSPPVALVRLEQLHPWPGDRVATRIEAFPRADTVVWAQEEPANMGAWGFVRERIQAALLPTQQLTYAGRPEAASPAVGSMAIHRKEQATLVATAFAGLD
jgi:2-oxoglutarate dehydrogenase E1 component